MPPGESLGSPNSIYTSNKHRTTISDSTLQKLSAKGADCLAEQVELHLLFLLFLDHLTAGSKGSKDQPLGNTSPS